MADITDAIRDFFRDRKFKRHGELIESAEEYYRFNSRNFFAQEEGYGSYRIS